MKHIENWSKAICIVTIISGVLVSVIPKNKLSSAYKTLVAILLLYLFLSPVNSLIDDISSFSFNSSAYDENEMYSIADVPIIESGETALSETITSLLYENGYKAKCKVKLTKRDDLYSADIFLYGKFNDEEQTEIKNILSNSIDAEMQISFSGEVYE